MNIIIRFQETCSITIKLNPSSYTGFPTNDNALVPNTSIQKENNKVGHKWEHKNDLPKDGQQDGKRYIQQKKAWKPKRDFGGLGVPRIQYRTHQTKFMHLLIEFVPGNSAFVIDISIRNKCGFISQFP